MKPILLAVAVSALAMFSLAGLYTGVLAHAFIAQHLAGPALRTPPNLPLVFAGYVFLALCMTLVHRRLFYGTRPTTWTNARFGMLAGVGWLMPYSLVLFGVYAFPYLALPLDFCWALVEQGLGGVIIGAILGRRYGRPFSVVDQVRQP
ncbi:hypothetical protein [Massilia sp. TSP1-1-2]|uniref:hypothetical protein n=1 Tax=unclassified Massilia TaxID=2609279 RepID=UPI003CF12257